MVKKIYVHFRLDSEDVGNALKATKDEKLNSLNAFVKRLLKLELERRQGK